MSDIRKSLAELRRPQMLIRAARSGMIDYNRNRDLKRLQVTDAPISPEITVSRLIAEEQRLEEIRQAGKADYSLIRHIEVMIALLSEVTLLPRNPAAG